MIGKYVRRAMATGSLGNDINIEQEREYAPTGISLIYWQEMDFYRGGVYESTI